MNMAIVMLIVIVLAIAIGFKTNINIGVLAMVFSYIVGCYVMGLKASAIVAMWPIKIFFILVSVSFFYNFATLNGSLDKLALNILYKFGKTVQDYSLCGICGGLAYVRDGRRALRYYIFVMSDLICHLQQD